MIHSKLYQDGRTYSFKEKTYGNRKVLLDLLKHSKDISVEEDLTDDLKHNLEAIMKNVNDKQKLVKTLDEELVKDDDIEKAA